ncbi:MAG: hypothetical protein KAJ20_00380 [Candidatus Aenigmarchaeota archaeon]|nr:hypothetical protein [Candidatus Aenigmarchaeota archaeon]MCK5234449.1 hypothetical protein [Candidatus Aenigmarchaeota archaeon]MCK5289328.1 hypothetical protein [Candidatus Aenigmarchaeota archaeon]MCK5372775.1 hypothetical protein [Candidatus Aenigmarchaeota archaeon]MCK5452025.1 hypothetical protein [Candidatus Aenigmarchaeota archaeon]
MIIIAFLFGIFVRNIHPNYKSIRDLINTYIMYIGLPLMIFVSLTGIGKIDIGWIILISILYNIISTAALFRIYKRKKIRGKTKASVFLCSTYGNVGYLGIPYCIMFFGNVGASFAAIFTIITTLFHFSLGIMLSSSYLKNKKIAAKEMINPLSIGMIIALALSQLNIAIPDIINSISHFSIYLILFLIGLTTTLTRPTKDYLRGIEGKFIISPLIMAILLFATGNLTAQYLPFMLLSIMPPAFANTILSINYGFDKEYTSRFTSITTIGMIIIFSITLMLI